MIDALLSLVPRHGVTVLFLAASLSCFGVPIPTSALMLAAGAFIAAKDLHPVPVVAAAVLGALIGDQAGYWAGRYGGAPLWDRFRARPKLTKVMDQSAATLQGRISLSVMLSRFPFSALGPWVNLAAGATRIRWGAFSLAALVGDVAWVLVYVGLGYTFAARVKDLGATMGSVVGMLSAGLVAVILGRALWARRKA